MTFLRLAARIWQHTLGHRIILKYANIHLEHVYIPTPSSLEINASNAYLLYS